MEALNKITRATCRKGARNNRNRRDIGGEFSPARAEAKFEKEIWNRKLDKKAAEKALDRVDSGSDPLEKLIKEALKVL